MLSQIEDLQEQVKTNADADDEIMAQVNKKVDEWKVRIKMQLVVLYTVWNCWQYPARHLIFWLDFYGVASGITAHGKMSPNKKICRP